MTSSTSWNWLFHIDGNTIPLLYTVLTHVLGGRNMMWRQIIALTACCYQIIVCANHTFTEQELAAYAVRRTKG